MVKNYGIAYQIILDKCAENKVTFKYKCKQYLTKKMVMKENTIYDILHLFFYFSFLLIFIVC